MEERPDLGKMSEHMWESDPMSRAFISKVREQALELSELNDNVLRNEAFSLRNISTSSLCILSLSSLSALTNSSPSCPCPCSGRRDDVFGERFRLSRRARIAARVGDP